MTWFAVDSLSGGWTNNFFQNGYSACNLYTNSIIVNPNQAFDTLLNGRKAWSGNSNGWRYTALWINLQFLIKPSRLGLINAVRFVFQSDSIQTNKAGWILDEFNVGQIETPGGLNDYTNYNQLPIYPNPSSSGHFAISFPSSYVKGFIQVYNLHGQKILDQVLTKNLDLSMFTKGLYYYKTSIEGKNYSGVLNKN